MKLTTLELGKSRYIWKYFTTKIHNLFGNLPFFLIILDKNFLDFDSLADYTERVELLSH